jgi:hypothetical protein
MAGISFFVPTNMVTVGVTNPVGTVTQETSTEITFTDGFNTAEYFGSFTYVGNDFFGTWTSFREFAGAVLTIDAGNFSVDAHVAEPYIKDNLLPKLFPLLLTGNDVITGSTGNDGLLEGYDGNDLIAGGGGSDYIDGGTGTNTALYTGNHTDYSFVARSEINIVLKGVQVTDLRVGSPSGTDQDVNIQFFQFDDGIFSFTSGQLIPQSQTTAAGLAVAVEATMYNATGTAAEINSLTTNFLPPQITNATSHGLNPQVYACEALGLVFAFGNENGSTAFSNNFGPSNSAMPNTTAGDAAFAAAASTAIFGSASTANLVNVMQSFVSNWKGFFTANGVPGAATAAEFDLAARGAAWGDMVGVALVNNIGPLNGQVANFLNDVALGTAVYGASLVGQPAHQPFQGA